MPRFCTKCGNQLKDLQILQLLHFHASHISPKYAHNSSPVAAIVQPCLLLNTVTQKLLNILVKE